jgi:hypothetical protein
MKKDWTGNRRSTFAQLGASNHSDYERPVTDYYATDPIAIDLLCQKEELFDVWECSCGGGHLAKRLEEKGLLSYASDLHDHGYGQTGVDFLKTKRSHSWIVTNPPYRNALEFCRHAISQSSNVAMLLKITFLEGQKRQAFFRQNPPSKVYVFSKRLQCAMNGDFGIFKDKSSAACYAWFVWTDGFEGLPRIDWI